MTAFRWVLAFGLVWLFFGLVGVAAVLLGLWLMNRRPAPVRHHRKAHR